MFVNHIKYDAVEILKCGYLPLTGIVWSVNTQCILRFFNPENGSLLDEEAFAKNEEILSINILEDTDFFILTKRGHLYRYNLANKTLDRQIIFSHNDTEIIDAKIQTELMKVVWMEKTDLYKQKIKTWDILRNREPNKPLFLAERRGKFRLLGPRHTYHYSRTTPRLIEGGRKVLFFGTGKNDMDYSSFEVWDLETQEQVYNDYGSKLELNKAGGFHPGKITNVEFVGKDHILAAGGGSVSLYLIENHERKWTTRLENGYIRTISVDPTKQYALVTNGSKYPFQICLTDGRVISPKIYLEYHKETWSRCAAYLGETHKGITGSNEGDLHLWDLGKGCLINKRAEEQGVIKNLGDQVKEIIQLQNENHLGLICEHSTKVINVEEKTVYASYDNVVFSGPTPPFIPRNSNSCYYVDKSEPKTLKKLNLLNGHTKNIYNANYEISSFAIDTKGQNALIGLIYSQVKYINLNSGSEHYEFTSTGKKSLGDVSFPDRARFMAISQCGHTGIVWSNNLITTWDLRCGEILNRKTLHQLHLRQCNNLAHIFSNRNLSCLALHSRPIWNLDTNTFSEINYTFNGETKHAFGNILKVLEDENLVLFGNIQGHSIDFFEFNPDFVFLGSLMINDDFIESFEITSSKKLAIGFSHGWLKIIDLREITRKA